MLENLDNIMHLRFNFDACPMHSPSGFVHLTHQNLSARALFCLNSLAKLNTQLLIYKYFISYVLKCIQHCCWNGNIKTNGYTLFWNRLYEVKFTWVGYHALNDIETCFMQGWKSFWKHVFRQDKTALFTTLSFFKLLQPWNQNIDYSFKSSIYEPFIE